MSNPVFVRRVSWECRTCGRVVVQEQEPTSCSDRDGCTAGMVLIDSGTADAFIDLIETQGRRESEFLERVRSLVPRPIPWENR